MKRDIISARVAEVTEYVLRTHDNIRHTAKVFGVCKSTIHKDLSERLPKTNPQLYQQVYIILKDNKYSGQLKGGQVTSERYGKWKKLS